MICDEITAELLAEHFFLSTFRFSRLWLGIDESVNVWYNKKTGVGAMSRRRIAFITSDSNSTSGSASVCVRTGETTRACLKRDIPTG